MFFHVVCSHAHSLGLTKLSLRASSNITGEQIPVWCFSSKTYLSRNNVQISLHIAHKLLFLWNQLTARSVHHPAKSEHFYGLMEKFNS